jgi:hypothetical protein
MKSRLYQCVIMGALLLSATAWMAAAQNEAAPDPLLADMQRKADAVTREAQLLRDEKDIEKLTRGFGYYLDKKMWDQVVALFADDATFELGQNGVYAGKASIRHALDQFGPQGLQHGELFNHMLLQPVVHVSDDGNTAKARWRGFNQAGVFGKRAVWGEGIYENEYVKQDGAWKIGKLHYFNSFTTPYEQGWAKEVMPSRREVAKGFEPDLPPSVTYEAFPQYFVPPFHYPNPVTDRPPTIGKAAVTQTVSQGEKQ